MPDLSEAVGLGARMPVATGKRKRAARPSWIAVQASRAEIVGFTRASDNVAVPPFGLCGLSLSRAELRTATLKATVRSRSFLGNVGLIGAIALLVLVANGLLNDRLPAAWIFATAISGTLIVASAVTAATHRSKQSR
jgi:hypothetical protein